MANDIINYFWLGLAVIVLCVVAIEMGGRRG